MSKYLVLETTGLYPENGDQIIRVNYEDRRVKVKFTVPIGEYTRLASDFNEEDWKDAEEHEVDCSEAYFVWYAPFVKKFLPKITTIDVKDMLGGKKINFVQACIEYGITYNENYAVMLKQLKEKLDEN